MIRSNTVRRDRWVECEWLALASVWTASGLWFLVPKTRGHAIIGPGGAA